PHQEAGRIGGERAEQRRGLVAGGEEQRGKERSEDRVKIEVVPFENRTDGRRDDDPPFRRCIDGGGCSDVHCFGGRAHSSSSGIQRRKQGPGDRKRGVCYCCNRKGERAKSWRFCSTRKQKFSNARDSSLFIALVTPLLLADELRDGPESGGELGRRLVARAGERYRYDFLHCSGTIR